MGIYRIVILTAVLAVLSSCGGDGDLWDRYNLRSQTEDAEGTTGRKAGTVEEDVEAPDVFAVTGEALWDGRPSLGGIWVAHADVGDPERVIMRNPSNGRSVVGALFRRERDVPGPQIQVSSDAAEALGLIAGQPQELSVTALRRRPVPAEESASDEVAAVAAPEEVIESTLEPVAIANDANYSSTGSGASDDMN